MAKSLYGQLLKNSIFKSSLRDAVIISIDEIAQYYWESDKIDWNIDSGDFPNIAPPFENFFCQYAMPLGHEIVTEEGKQKIDAPEMYGFHFRARKLDWSEKKWWIQGKEILPEVKWLLSFNMYVYSPLVAEYVIKDTTNLTIGIDAQGKHVPIWGERDKPMLVDMDEETMTRYLADPEFSKMYLNSLFAVLHPCLLAITFMHTKNTVFVTNEPSKKSRTHRRYDAKRDETSYKFYTLDIRPLREVLRREGIENARGTGIAKAAHLRRGHFADYTDGRGLFGKYNGLFWFDSTFVGDKHKGTVEKDYEIHINKDA